MWLTFVAGVIGLLDDTDTDHTHFQCTEFLQILKRHQVLLYIHPFCWMSFIIAPKLRVVISVRALVMGRLDVISWKCFETQHLSGVCFGCVLRRVQRGSLSSRERCGNFKGQGFACG